MKILVPTLRASLKKNKFYLAGGQYREAHWFSAYDIDTKDIQYIEIIINYEKQTLKNYLLYHINNSYVEPSKLISKLENLDNNQSLLFSLKYFNLIGIMEYLERRSKKITKDVILYLINLLKQEFRTKKNYIKFYKKENDYYVFDNDACRSTHEHFRNLNAKFYKRCYIKFLKDIKNILNDMLLNQKEAFKILSKQFEHIESFLFSVSDSSYHLCYYHNINFKKLTKKDCFKCFLRSIKNRIQSFNIKVTYLFEDILYTQRDKINFYKSERHIKNYTHLTVSTSFYKNKDVIINNKNIKLNNIVFKDDEDDEKENEYTSILLRYNLLLRIYKRLEKFYHLKFKNK